MNHETILSYTAGLLDGEGCFRINKMFKGKYDVFTTYQPVIIVGMTDKEVIHWLQSQFGGYINKVKAQRENQEDQWRWQLSEKEIVKQFTKDILPYLKVKRLQAMILLEFCVAFPGRKRYGDRTDEAERDKYYYVMSAANSKGPGSSAKKQNYSHCLSPALKPFCWGVIPLVDFFRRFG